MELAIFCGIAFITGIGAGLALCINNKASDTQVNINIVHVDNRDERHYTLKGHLSPCVVCTNPNSLTLMPFNLYGSNIQIEGRDEMKLLRASLNDIAKVDRWA